MMGCQGRTCRLSRADLAAIMCTVAMVAVALGASETSASASTSHNYRGLAYGFTNDYGSIYSYYWASASYATMASVGAPEVAKLACGAAFDEPWAGKACYYAADLLVKGVDRHVPAGCIPRASHQLVPRPQHALSLRAHRVDWIAVGSHYPMRDLTDCHGEGYPLVVVSGPSRWERPFGKRAIRGNRCKRNGSNCSDG
jgi:hypothetical protein